MPERANQHICQPLVLSQHHTPMHTGALPKSQAIRSPLLTIVNHSLPIVSHITMNYTDPYNTTKFILLGIDII